LELFGFTLGNPFDLMKDEITDGIMASEMKYFVNRKVELYGYLVTVKSTSTVNKKRMQFGTFLDKQGEFIDTVHFPNTTEKYLFRGKGVYKLYGKVTEEFDFLTLEVHRMEKMDWVVDPRYAE
jgi:DNA polymerase-3 subunit alpha